MAEPQRAAGLDGGPAVPLSDLVAAFAAKAISEGSPEIRRAEGQSGRLHLSLEVCLNQGEVPWHTASVRFDRLFKHGR